jgi:hypothetical protein
VAAASRWRATGLSRVEQAKERLGEPYARLVVDVACLHIQSLARTGARPSEQEYADFLLEKARSSRHRVQNALRDLTEFLETLQQREDGQSISAALAGDIGCEARSLYELSR